MKLFLKFLFGAAAIVLFVQAAAAAPIALTEAPAHDFGVALEGQVIEHTFIVKNSGDTVLNITDVIPP